ncbi:MAG: hypothetical protein ACI936_001474, partial [Paraglaciecola sp.]
MDAWDPFPFLAKLNSNINTKIVNVLRLTETHFKSHSKIWNSYNLYSTIF